MEIDVIIEKAKLIKEADNPKGIDNLIKSLESHKANKGDIRKKRLYSFLFGSCDTTVRKTGWWLNVEASLYGLTTKTVKKLNKYYNGQFFRHDEQDSRLAGYVIDSDEEIYDYVFDVEFYQVSHKLEVLLYKHNFDVVGNFNVPADRYYNDPPEDDRRRLMDFGKITEVINHPAKSIKSKARSKRHERRDSKTNRI